MKKYFFLAGLLITGLFVQGQILKKIADKVKNKVENKADQKVDSTIDKSINDVMNPSGNNKTSSDGNKDPNSRQENKNNESGPANLKTYSKYDFVPGEKIVVYEDFMQDAIGDFPSKWNTNASGETVTVEGQQGHWFRITKGVFMPEFIDSLPDNFTLEFDVMVDKPAHSWGISTIIAELQDRNKPEKWREATDYYHLNMLPGVDGNGQCSYDRKRANEGEAAITTKLSQFSNINRPVHVAFWRQKERLRVYINEEKTWDVPKAFLPTVKLNALIFYIQLTDNWHFLINNLRLGIGAPDTRKKILEQNKWVTHGILFDVNSATIKPESYGTLKEMASVLKEFPELRVKIVGHTDADGADAANLELSKRRAASVKAALAKEFGIDENRMETDGKGESEPIDNNTTPAGKANNRRVEFIKI